MEVRGQDDRVPRTRRGRAVERRDWLAEAAADCGELSARVVVLKQGGLQQGCGGEPFELGAQILDLSFQLHSPVLEPSFHL